MTTAREQRDSEIVRLRKAGVTLEELARRFRLATATVSGVCAKAGLVNSRVGHSGCGTVNGYQHHITYGEEVCDICRVAHTNYHAGYKAGRAFNER